MKHLYLFSVVILASIARHTFGEPPLICSGDAALCSRRLNEITLLGAHNIGYKKAKTQNQEYPFADLLAKGVRYAKIRVNRVPAFLNRKAPSFMYQGKKYVATACHSLNRQTLYEEAGIKDVLRSIPTKELRTKIDTEIEKLKKEIESLKKSSQKAKLLRAKAKLARKEAMRKIKSPFLFIAETKGDKLTNFEMKLFKATVGTDEHPGPIPFNPCLADPSARAFIDVLSDIKKFLDTHPLDIFILNVEDYVFDLRVISDLFGQAGLLPFMYIHKAGTPWPTVQEMITNNKRLFVVIQTWGAALSWGSYPWKEFPWLHDKTKQIKDTKYEFHSSKDLLTHDKDTATDPSLLLLMQHFVTQKIGGDKEQAERVNTYDAIMKRARMVMQKTGKKPNIINLDFVGVPSINEQLRAIRHLNGIGEFAHTPIIKAP